MTHIVSAAAPSGTSTYRLPRRLARLGALMRRRQLSDAEVLALWHRQVARAEARRLVDDIVQAHLRAGLTLR